MHEEVRGSELRAFRGEKNLTTKDTKVSKERVCDPNFVCFVLFVVRGF
jgi:hypothetical protein